MNKAKAIAGILALFLVLPIWFYILYQVLEAINATELTWFLFWVYVPATMLMTTLARIAGED